MRAAWTESKVFALGEVSAMQASLEAGVTFSPAQNMLSSADEWEVVMSGPFWRRNVALDLVLNQ